MSKKARFVKTLKENEAVWINAESLMYKRDSRFVYYKDGEKIAGSFIYFNPYTDKIIAALKDEENIIGYVFNGVQVSPEEKKKLVAGLKKYMRQPSIDKEFKPLFKNSDDEETNVITLNFDSVFVIGTRYNKDVKYIHKVIDTTMDNEYNPDPFVEFNIIDYIENKFSKDFSNLFYDSNFRYILMKSSQISSIEKELYQILKTAYNAGKDNELLFTYKELLELSDYIIDRDYYYGEDNSHIVQLFLSEKYIQNNKVCDTIYNILMSYEYK